MLALHVQTMLIDAGLLAVIAYIELVHPTAAPLCFNVTSAPSLLAPPSLQAAAAARNEHLRVEAFHLLATALKVSGLRRAISAVPLVAWSPCR